MKILRLRLKEPTPILSRREYIKDHDPQSYLEYTSFSAAVLASCQRLHDEAKHILYQENVLSIYCHPGPHREEAVRQQLQAPTMWCCVMDLNENIGTSLESAKATKYDLCSLVKKRYWTASQEQRRDLALCKAAALFEEYRVIVEFRGESDVWTACRLLWRMLWDKTVTLILEGL